MYVFTREGLGQAPMLSGSIAGMLGDSDYKKTVEEFLNKVRVRPQDYKDLLLTARLHPSPWFSETIYRYPIPVPTGKEYLADSILLSDIPQEQVLKELWQIADTNLGPEIKAEKEHWHKAFETFEKVDRSKFKPFLLEAAQLEPKGDPFSHCRNLHRVGYIVADRLLGSTGKALIVSNDASEAHLTKLGLILFTAASVNQKKDPAFKKEVDRERKKRAEQKRKKRPQRRGRK